MLAEGWRFETGRPKPAVLRTATSYGHVRWAIVGRAGRLARLVEEAACDGRGRTHLPDRILRRAQDAS